MLNQKIIYAFAYYYKYVSEELFTWFSRESKRLLKENTELANNWVNYIRKLIIFES